MARTSCFGIVGSKEQGDWQALGYHPRGRGVERVAGSQHEPQCMDAGKECRAQMVDRSPALHLSPTQVRALEHLVGNGNGPTRVARRARAILVLGQRPIDEKSASVAGLGKSTLRRLRDRFIAEGMDGLTDRSRPGRPCSTSGRIIARVVALRVQPPPEGAAPPGIRAIAASVGVPVTRAHRILGEHGIHGSPPTSDLGPWDFVGLYVDQPTRLAVLGARSGSAPKGLPALPGVTEVLGAILARRRLRRRSPPPPPTPALMCLHFFQRWLPRLTILSM